MKGSTNRRLRRLHQYLGLFFAPALLLFSLSGALQTYRWQEPKGYGGSPPGWIVWLASVHKDQALPRPAAAGPEAGPPPAPKAKAADPAASAGAAKAGEHKGPGRRQGLMLFVGLFGLALFLSTLLGIAIALANAANRRTNLLVLAAGVAVPLLLLFL
jgi:hypothetical protein